MSGQVSAAWNISASIPTVAALLIGAYWNINQPTGWSAEGQ
jgi:hypothetical protein